MKLNTKAKTKTLNAIEGDEEKDKDGGKLHSDSYNEYEVEYKSKNYNDIVRNRRQWREE